MTCCKGQTGNVMAMGERGRVQSRGGGKASLHWVKRDRVHNVDIVPFSVVIVEQFSSISTQKQDNGLLHLCSIFNSQSLVLLATSPLILS